MSNRSLIELNHDYCPPRDDAALLAWAKAFRLYLGSGDPSFLPDGVERKWMRHHSDPCPFENPLEFELSTRRLTGETKRAKRHRTAPKPTGER